MQEIEVQTKRVLVSRQNITKVLQIKSAEELKGYFFAKEGNTILYPWFVLGTRWGNKTVEGGVTILNRPGTAKYELVIGKKKRTITIMGSAQYGVPSEFEYDVFHGILAVNAIQKKNGIDDDGIIEFTVSDIINILGISDSGNNYKRIHESILRLITTSYLVDDFFVHRTNPKEILTPPSKINEEEYRDGIDSWMEKQGKVQVSAEMTDDGSIDVTTTKYAEIRLFADVSGTLNQRSDNGEILSSTYKLSLNRDIVSNMTNHYARHFDIAMHFRLKSPALKRFYEIIAFQAYKRKNATFSYDIVAGMIPLSSGRMNKQYIIGYAKKLKEMGYIEDYDSKTEKDKINVFFITTERGNIISTIKPDGSFVYSGSGKENNIYSIEDGNILKVRIRQVLNSRKITSINEEEIFIMANDSKINKAKLGTDDIILNLEYVFRRRGKIENLSGYLCKAISENYASELKKKKEEKTQHIKKAIEEERGDEKKRAELVEKKRKQDDVFNTYINKLSPQELSKLHQEYNIPGRINDNAKRLMLKGKLFSSGVLSD